MQLQDRGVAGTAFRAGAKRAVYLAGEGETLWDICKKYDVPMDGMREMNNLTQDEIRPGDQLLIVKGYAVDKEMQIV